MTDALTRARANAARADPFPVMTIAGERLRVVEESLVTSWGAKGRELRYVAVRVMREDALA